MSTSLVEKALANRVAALNSLKLRKDYDLHSSDEVLRRRQFVAANEVVFASRRAA